MIVLPIIDKKLFARIEKELYTYNSNVREINERREELLYSSPKPDSAARSQGRISDQTAMKAAKLSQINETDTVRWANVIHDSFERMPAEYMLLIKLKYFEGNSNQVVMDKLHVSQSAYYEWRENIVISILLLATQRGLVKPFAEKFRENLG